MKCMMCNNSYCSCKSKCSKCWLDNSIVYVVNDCIKNWLTVEEARNNKSTIQEYWKKIDAITLVEYIHWAIDKSKFDEAIENYKKKSTPVRQPKKEVIPSPLLNTPNPNEMCVFPDGWDIWSRCIYCNSIKRYMNGKPCPKHTQNAGSTVA